MLVDGAFRADLSKLEGLPAGVTLLSFAAALAQVPDWLKPALEQRTGEVPHALAALNTAFATDGFVLRIPAGVSVAQPISIVVVSTGTVPQRLTSLRGVVIAEAGSNATLVEHYKGAEDQGAEAGVSGLTSIVSDITLGEGAVFNHVKVQNGAAEAAHLAESSVSIAAGAVYDNFALLIGSKLTRNEIRSVMTGRGAECRLHGAMLLADAQHGDTTTMIDHASPGCTSREVYKSVIDDRARAVFQGKILVRKDSQQTDGHQLNRALLLSDRAEIDIKPELEIYADDVKCSHGAAAGALDDNALFYLRARGIPAAEARALLIGAFVGEMLEMIADETIRGVVGTLVADWLARRPLTVRSA